MAGSHNKNSQPAGEQEHRLPPRQCHRAILPNHHRTLLTRTCRSNHTAPARSSPCWRSSCSRPRRPLLHPSAAAPGPRAQQACPPLYSTSLPPPPPPEDNSNIPSEEDTDYRGSVDWDAEWKKVMEDQQRGVKIDRPGKDFYKSEAELVAIRAANTVTRQVNRLAENVMDNTGGLPSWETLKGDWKFWVGVLAVLSFGGAFLSAVSVPADMVTPADANASPSSYYI